LHFKFYNMKIFTLGLQIGSFSLKRLNKKLPTAFAARLLMMVVLCLGVGESWGQIAAWQFGSPASLGTEVTYNATTNDANLNTAVLSRGAGISATALGRGFAANNWDVSATKANAVTNNEYFQFSINAKPGYKASLSTLTVRLRRSGTTAPNAYIWKYSTDGSTFNEIGTDISFTSTADGVDQTPIDLSGISSLQNVTSSTTILFRLYAWGGTATSATFSVGRYAAGITTNSLSVDGTVTSASPSAPTVITTSPATNISTTGSDLSGNVTSDGGSTITGRGIVYSLTSTNSAPQIGGSGVTQLTTSGTTGTYTVSASSLSVNSQYSYNAYAINAIGTSYGTVNTFYTLANVPNAPTVNNPTISTLDVTIDGNGNPSNTLYAIRENVVNNPTAKYVQAGGSLGASPVYQTAATWGTKTVTGLVSGTSYGFGVSAQNGATVNTAYGTNGTGTTSAAPVPVVTGGSPTGTVGVVFSYFISATNAPTSYAVSSGTLPAGLTLNTTTGEIAGTPTAAGAVSVDVTATNGSGTSAPATLNFTIAQGSQTITFGALPVKTTTDPDFVLTATVNSPLTITYTSSNPAVATVSGNTVHIVGAGTTNITASQAGNANYSAAADVVQPLTVINIIAKWTFESGTISGTATTPTISSPVAETGAQTTGSLFTGLHASSATVWSAATGNGSAKSFAADHWATGDYFQFKVNATGYYNLSLKWDQRGSATGPRDFKIQYSTNGTSFTDLTTYTAPNNAGAAISWSAASAVTTTALSFDLSSATVLNGSSTVFIRLVVNSGTGINGSAIGTGGTSNVDNFTVIGTLMPAFYPRTSATDLSLVSNWTDDVNGVSGTSPLDFTTANQLFNVSRNGIVLGTWTVSGGSNILLSSALEMAPVSRLITGSGSTVNFNNQSVTLRSTPTGTASIGTISGTLTGATNVTMERYIKLRLGGTGRAYRLLTPTVNTTGSMKLNWMENGINTAIGTNVDPVPGYGTQITGAGGNTNGFDKTASNAASLYLTTNAVTPTYTAIGNTSGTLDAKTGYFIYIRGDRNQDMQIPLAPNMPTSSTTLRATGTMLQGTQTSFTNPLLGGTGVLNLVTNPYPSAIDWSLVQGASTNLSDSYTFWDPNFGTRGGFVTVNTAGSASSGLATQYIQPGQAFFVQSTSATTPTISIQEGHKVASNNNDVFLVPPPPVESFRTELYFTEPNGFRRIADGAIAVYDNSFKAAVDEKDARELNNWDENIAIAREDKHLAIESRPVIGKSDDLPLFMNNMKQQAYEFEFTPAAFTNTNLKAELVDNFLHTRTLLSVVNTTVVPFTVTADAASKATDRFKVVFGSFGNPTGIDVITIKASRQGGAVQVDWTSKTELDMVSYEVERSTYGTAFTKVNTTNALGNSTTAVNYNWMDMNPNPGTNFYRIKAIDKAGNVKYSDIAQVMVGKAEPGITVYPNPVPGNSFTVDMNNLVKGNYLLSLYDNMGALVYTEQFVHDGSQATKMINLKSGIAPGVYQLQLSNEKGFKTTQKIFKN
jgi:hypothetical protein